MINNFVDKYKAALKVIKEERFHKKLVEIEQNNCRIRSTEEELKEYFDGDRDLKYFEKLSKEYIESVKKQEKRNILKLTFNKIVFVGGIPTVWFISLLIKEILMKY